MNPRETRLTVTGMTCDTCVQRVTRALLAVDGIQGSLLLGLALALTACADGTLAPRTQADPGNPNAPEGRVIALAESSPPSTANAAVYACPMHPEVTSPTPGTCPRCGMKLVLGTTTP